MDSETLIPGVPDYLLAPLIATIVGLISEALSWFFIYSSDGYQKQLLTISKLNKKIKKLSATERAKKAKQYEDELADANRNLSMSKIKSDFFLFFGFNIAVYAVMSSLFEGRVIAKLPFEAGSWIRGITHRNLPGDDYTDCAMLFLYIVSSMAIRGNLQKLLGTTPKSAGAGMFGS